MAYLNKEQVVYVIEEGLGIDERKAEIFFGLMDLAVEVAVEEAGKIAYADGYRQGYSTALLTMRATIDDVDTERLC